MYTIKGMGVHCITVNGAAYISFKICIQPPLKNNEAAYATRLGPAPSVGQI